MKTLRLLSFLFLSTISCYSQTVDVDSLIDDLYDSELDLIDNIDTKGRYDFVYLTADFSTFSNNSVFESLDFRSTIYNYGLQCYYFNNKGFYVGVSGNFSDYNFELLNIAGNPGLSADTITSYTILSAGYHYGLFDQQLRLRVGYNQYIYPKSYANAPLYNGDFNGGISYFKKYIGLRSNYSYLMGKDNKHAISADIYGKFKLYNFGSYNYIQIRPTVSWYFSSEVVEYDKNGHLDPTDIMYFPDYAFKTEFGLQNKSVALPITLSYGDFDFEFECAYHMPRSLDPIINYDNVWVFGFSLGYIFGVN